ncbi:uncharacterized protein RSE6_09152 [Rhynchosporium secalis]|uniref:Uncharacterized protein n=1 Tax=Rhynchosporium secalis TaxID=38038 RepID=A0A1E1MH72_RHYSE|nr:uncharacterized protein RSE6_09152 [Rhynchosporium secalis]
MASRSLKPASYLASAAQQAPNRSPRPSFTRSSSNSSTISTRSEDSIVATLRGIEYRRCGSASVTQQRPLDTPGRKRSQPIAIELPPRGTGTGTAAYTPLSARGDLPGGYFPNHEEVTKSYRSHPFSNHFGKLHQPQPESPNMSPTFSPTSDTTPKMSSHMLIPSAFGQLSPSIPETLRLPVGKYHPSNYKSPVSTGSSTTTSTPRGSMPPSSLTIPAQPIRRGSKDRPVNERKSSEVKRKLQEYQRNMIAQARSAAPARATVDSAVVKDVRPVIHSPRLQPLGSPGPITPFVLEEADGYIVAGSTEVRKENERQIQMILSRPSQASPVESRV